MNYPLRSIAFVADLIHPPARHNPESMQRVHNVTFSDAECRYQNFQIIPGGARLSNPSKKPTLVSSCALMQDRVQVREEMTGIGRDDFRARVERVAKIVVSNLNVPVFIVRQFVIRSLVNLRKFKDTRDFLATSVLGVGEEDFEILERSPDLLGIRFAFNSTNMEEGVYNVRIESYSQDHRSLFIENVGTFRKPVTSNGLDEIGSDFDRAYSYIEERLIPFVSRFDRTI